MKFNHFLGLVLITLCLITASPVFGDNYGFYSWSRGWPSVEAPDFLSNEIVLPIEDINIESDCDHYSLGYMYVRPTTPDDLLDFRFIYGLDFAVTKTTDFSFNDTSSVDLSSFTEQYSDVFDALGYGFMTKLTLGFGLIRTEALRVWAGPSIRLSANFLQQDKKEIYYYFNKNMYIIKAEPWGIMASAGGGIEAGITYHFKSELSLDLSAGFYYLFIGLYQDAQIRSELLSAQEDRAFFWGEEPTITVQFSLHFNL